jgi:hypothetical protein
MPAMQTPSASIAELTRNPAKPSAHKDIRPTDNLDNDDSDDSQDEGEDDFGMAHDDFAPISRSARPASMSSSSHASPERTLPSTTAAAPAAVAAPAADLGSRYNPFATPVW